MAITTHADIKTQQREVLEKKGPVYNCFNSLHYLEDLEDHLGWQLIIGVDNTMIRYEKTFIGPSLIKIVKYT